MGIKEVINVIHGGKIDNDIQQTLQKCPEPKLKIDNDLLFVMQGKNQFLNIVEHQTISTIMRLLMSNQHFHEGKKGTEEYEAQKYIEEVSGMIGLNPEEVTYNQL